ASPRITPEPLDSFLNLWEEECAEITQKLTESNPNAEFRLIPYKEFIYVDWLIFAEEKRNQGLGTKFFQELIEVADEINCPLALTPDTSFGSSDESRLEEYYTRFGFIKNIGKDRDFSTNHKMIRPRKNS
ncbi:MAG: GNAT family N-acetyltransferase, partial [Acidobacteriota bacterium]